MDLSTLKSLLFVSISALCIGCDIIPDDHSFIIEHYFTFKEWTNMQGGAIYDNKLVCLTATDLSSSTPNGYIYDISTKEKICDLTFNSSLGNKTYQMPHANQVSFGTDFYNSESDFPLLYVSQVNGGTGYDDLYGELGVLVYNLEQVDDGTYIPQLVQAIIPNQDDSRLMNKIGNYTPNYIVNPYQKQLIIIGYPNNSWYDLTGRQPVTIINLPDIYNNEVVFSDTDVLESFTLFPSFGPQQSICVNNHIVSVGGDMGQASFRIIDLASKEIVYYKDMTDITYGEPQFIGLWNGSLLYYEYGDIGDLYTIRLPNQIIDILR